MQSTYSAPETLGNTMSNVVPDAAVKAAYEAPEVIVYGTVTNLAMGGGKASQDTSTHFGYHGT